MTRAQNPNIEILMQAVERLGPLADEMVFVGGCATGLLITDAAAPPIRTTRDVDAIVQATSRADYYRLAGQLRERGFNEDVSDGAPLCRWVIEGIILDVMPTKTAILGFGNHWYEPAAMHAIRRLLPSGRSIRLVSGPYFLVTKLEAFAGRGRGDFLASHDIEDMIAVLDGRPEIIKEAQNADAALKLELSKRFTNLLQDTRFLEALPGHLPPGTTSPARASVVLNAIDALARMQ